MKWLSSYMSAGLDESLAMFTKHLLAAVFVTAADYTYHHLTHEGFVAISTVAPLVVGFPLVTSFVHWLKSLPKTDPAVPVVAPASTDFSGEIPQA